MRCAACGGCALALGGFRGEHEPCPYTPPVAAGNLYIQARQLMHSAPLPGPVKTRVFRDCRTNQKGASGLSPLDFIALLLPAAKAAPKHRFTEENT